MSRIKIALLIFGLVLIYIAIQEARLSRKARPTPRTITCADLAARGPGDNAYIILENYHLGDNFVYETGSRGAAGWRMVYIPAIPGPKMPGNPATSGLPQIIIKSNQVKSENDIGRVANRLQGMVINEIASLNREQKKLLSESYPGINLDTCWIVEHNRRPATLANIAAWGLPGLVLFASGLVLIFRRRPSPQPIPASV